MVKLEKKLAICLLFLRLSVFLVMLMWTLDKFINPEHAAKVFANFYFFPGASETFLSIVASLQLCVVFAFVIGWMPTYSYGFILLMHTVSTFSSYKQYLNPWNSLLFFAAWPMLAACLTLFVLRDFDTLLSVGNKKTVQSQK